MQLTKIINFEQLLLKLSIFENLGFEMFPYAMKLTKYQNVFSKKNYGFTRIRVFVVLFEIECRLCDSLPPTFFLRGYRHHETLSSIVKYIDLQSLKLSANTGTLTSRTDLLLLTIRQAFKNTNSSPPDMTRIFGIIMRPQ